MNIKLNFFTRLIKLMNVILMTAGFALCWYGYYASRIETPYFRKGNWLILALFLILYTVFGRIYDAFLISISKISEMIYSQVLALVMANIVMYIIIWLLKLHLPNPIPLVLAFGIQIVISIIWCVASHKWYYFVCPPKSTAVIYDMRAGLENLVDAYGLEKKFDIQSVLPIDECLEDISTLSKFDVVFLSGVHSKDRNMILKYCVNHEVEVFVIPRVGDLIMSGAKKVHMFHLPMLRVARYNPNFEYLFFKRVFDIVVSGLALIVASPFMLITAIAIKATDHGPVLYRQCRLTKDGKEFDVLKFRSMRVDAEKDGVARLSTGEKDDRITPIGHIIRKVRMDEVPQLINILKGDMSIVGPRPERPEIAKQYEETLPEFQLRLQAKAGLTGYAQVYGKYNTTPYDKLQMDLMYISNPSFWEDIKICFATVKILFMSESTEGIEEGSVTAIDNKKE